MPTVRSETSGRAVGSTVMAPSLSRPEEDLALVGVGLDQAYADPLAEREVVTLAPRPDRRVGDRDRAAFVVVVPDVHDGGVELLSDPVLEQHRLGEVDGAS